MDKRIILKFFVPLVVLSSICTGPLYNLLLFLNPSVLEYHWAFYYDDIFFTNLMVASFILFITIFFISMKYVEKIANEQLIILCIILIGFSSIFVGLAWTLEMFILVFILTSVTSAYLIPVILNVASNKVYSEYKNMRYLLIFPISSLIWLLLSVILFISFGELWRYLYFFTGTTIIVSSILFNLI